MTAFRQKNYTRDWRELHEEMLLERDARRISDDFFADQPCTRPPRSEHKIQILMYRAVKHEEMLALMPPAERRKMAQEFSIFSAADTVFKKRRDSALGEDVGFCGAPSGGESVFLGAVVTEDGDTVQAGEKIPHFGRKRTEAEREWAECHKADEAVRKKAERERKKEEVENGGGYEEAMRARTAV